MTSGDGIAKPLGYSGAPGLLSSAADRQRNPLRLYALIEIGIGLSTILVMVPLLPVMDWGYLSAFQIMRQAGTGIVAVRLVLAVLILIVRTTLMGAVFPVVNKIYHDRVGRARGLYGLALLLADQGDTAAAEARLREALREAPELGEARKLLKRIQQRGREKR